MKEINALFAGCVVSLSLSLFFFFFFSLSFFLSFFLFLSFVYCLLEGEVFSQCDGWFAPGLPS